MNYEQKQFISNVDSLLSEQRYEELNSLFTDELMQNADYDKLAYLCLYILTYRNEKNNNNTKTSLSLGNNTDELIHIFKKIKFLLWEFEFDKNDDSTQMLVDTIVSYDISAELIKTIVMTSSVNKENVLIELSNIF